MVVYRNTSHVRCQCQRLGTFGVLMDSSHREVSGPSQTWPIYPNSRPNAIILCEQQLEGDLETLGLVTYCTLCLSMLALILTVLVLSCLRGLKSNTRSIHSNTAAAMFLSKLVFLLGINQTEQQVMCVFMCFGLSLLPITKMPREAFLFISASFSQSCWKSSDLLTVLKHVHMQHDIEFIWAVTARTGLYIDWFTLAVLACLSTRTNVSVLRQRACAGWLFCICSALLISCA